MPTSKKITLSILLGMTLSVQADIVPSFIETKTWKQTGNRILDYAGGTIDLQINDGFWIPGTGPGIIFLGDFDGDGISDGGTTIFIDSIIQTTQLEPFRVDLVRLFSAPPSELDRPFIGFTDFSFTVWWDISVPFGTQEYTLAGYRYNKAYPATPGGRVLHDLEIVPGVYTYEVPVLDQPGSRIYPAVGIGPMLEAFPGRTQTTLDNGFRFTNDYTADGVIEFDPRNFMLLSWEGVTVFEVPTLDLVTISFLDAMGDPFVNDLGIQFPEFVLNENKYDGEYTIVPFFFSPGDLATAQVRIQRGDPTTQPFPSGYVGTRTFQTDIRFIDTYAGYIRFGVFPPGTPTALTLPGADFDGDGFSNFEEYILNTNPADATEFPGSAGPITTPADSGANPGVLTVTSLADGRCEISIDKRPYTGTAVSCNFEHSEDLVTWITIPEDGDVNGDGDSTDPGDWTVTEVVIDENVSGVDENGDGDMTDVFSRLTATSVSPITSPTVPAGPPSCFFRFVATLN